MEAAPIRDQVHDFTKACQALKRFAYAHNGQTDLERDTVATFVQSLEEEIGPFSSGSQDDPTLVEILSNQSLVD